MGGSQNDENLFGSPTNKDCSILESILGSPYLGGPVGVKGGGGLGVWTMAQMGEVNSTLKLEIAIHLHDAMQRVTVSLCQRKLLHEPGVHFIFHVPSIDSV